MNKIKSIKLERLYKLELPTLAEKVMELVEKHDPETLKITEANDLLIQQQSHIDILKMEYGAHELTEKVNTLRVQRAAYAAVISLHTRALNRIGNEGEDDGVRLARLTVDFYLTNLRRYNEQVTHVKLSEFFRKIEENEALETTFSTLGLTLYLNELRSVHSRIDKLLKNRKASIAARPKIRVAPIAKSVRTALRNLFSHINFAQTQNIDIDYLGLIADINEQISDYTRLISMRATLRAKKKAEAENGESGEVVVEDGAGGAGSSTEEPESTKMMTPLNYENRDGEKLDDNAFLNKEKTAARSSKNTQLPSIEDEA